MLAIDRGSAVHEMLLIRPDRKGRGVHGRRARAQGQEYVSCVRAGIHVMSVVAQGSAYMLYVFSQMAGCLRGNGRLGADLIQENGALLG
jgi:hypothetical protein